MAQKLKFYTSEDFKIMIDSRENDNKTPYNDDFLNRKIKKRILQIRELTNDKTIEHGEFGCWERYSNSECYPEFFTREETNFSKDVYKYMDNVETLIKIRDCM